MSQMRRQGLARLRTALEKHRFAAVDSETMMEWLNADLASSETTARDAWQDCSQLWAEAPTQTSEGHEVIYTHKKVFHSSYDLQVWDSETGAPSRKTEGIVTDADGTQRQRYLVHKTTSTKGEATPHYMRCYPALPEKWDKDPVTTALRRLFAEVVSEASQLDMGVQPPVGCELFQFCYRTVHALEKEKLKGDPGPEGVHNDGGTAAMIVVMRRDNLKPQTGGTRIWSMQQDSGKPTEADLESGKLLHTWQPTAPFDALFFLDESVKHEALQGELLDPSSEGLRDMFIMDVRRKGGSWSINGGDAHIGGA